MSSQTARRSHAPKLRSKTGVVPASPGWIRDRSSQDVVYHAPLPTGCPHDGPLLSRPYAKSGAQIPAVVFVTGLSDLWEQSDDRAASVKEMGVLHLAGATGCGLGAGGHHLHQSLSRPADPSGRWFDISGRTPPQLGIDGKTGRSACVLLGPCGPSALPALIQPGHTRISERGAAPGLTDTPWNSMGATGRS